MKEKQQAAQNVCLREFLNLNYNEFVYSSRNLHVHIITISIMGKHIHIIISILKNENINKQFLTKKFTKISTTRKTNEQILHNYTYKQEIQHRLNLL